MKLVALIGGVLLAGQAVAEEMPGPDSAARAEVLEVVDQFFEAMRTRDVAAWRRIMHPEGASFSMRPAGEGSEWKLRHRPYTEKFKQLAAAVALWDER